MTQTRLRWKKLKHQNGLPVMTAQYPMHYHHPRQRAVLNRLFKVEIFQDQEGQWILEIFANNKNITSVRGYPTLDEAAAAAESDLDRRLENFEQQAERHRASAQAREANHTRQSGEIDRFINQPAD